MKLTYINSLQVWVIKVFVRIAEVAIFVRLVGKLKGICTSEVWSIFSQLVLLV